MSYFKLILINPNYCKNNISFIFVLLNNDKIPSDLKLNVCLSFRGFVNSFQNIMNTEIILFFEGLHSSIKNLLNIPYLCSK